MKTLASTPALRDNGSDGLPDPAHRQTSVSAEGGLLQEMEAAGVDVAVLHADTAGVGKREARLMPPMVGGCHRRYPMAILLDHLIVPSRDPVASARSLAHLLGTPWEEARGHFTPVYVNDTLTLDFDRREQFDSHHYCFHVSDEEFDQIFARVQAAGIKYRSSPRGPDDMALNTRLGGRNFYWTDADGHIWEVLTVSYARQQAGAPVG